MYVVQELGLTARQHTVPRRCTTMQIRPALYGAAMIRLVGGTCRGRRQSGIGLRYVRVCTDTNGTERDSMRRVTPQSREQKSDLEVERAYRPPTGKISYEEVLYLVQYIRSTVPRVAVICNPLSASVVELPTSSFAVHRLTVPSVLSWASSAIEECTRYRLEVFHPKAFGQFVTGKSSSGSAQ
jgi:hypothetical protein